MSAQRFVFLASFLTLSACATQTLPPPLDYYKEKKIAAPSDSAFTHCSQYGCKRLTPLTLDPQDWTGIETAFGPPALSAAEEREKIKQTIGYLERLIGPRTGTQTDVAGTFRRIGQGQLDCVDESTNTTSYLLLLKERGLLNFHDVGGPDTRFPLIHAGRWPHQTAVMTDRQTQTAYAVDSWFHDNGKPAEIVTLENWKEGWKPDKEFR
jgi:hypothetical protein